MLATHYRFTLPADYDMQRIVDRVAARGSAFDQLPGLAFKAFLATTRGEFGHAENRYAPFYLWRDAAGFTDFLTGEAFGAVGSAFGRPQVESWQPVATALPTAAPSAGLWAALTRNILADSADLASWRRGEQKWVAAMTEVGALGSVAGLDAGRWQGVRFSLWRNAEAAAAVGAQPPLRVLYLAQSHGC